MFDTLDEKTQRFLVAGIFFSVFVLLLLFFRSYSPSQPAAVPTPPEQLASPPPEPDICDIAVLASCELQLMEQRADCSNESLLQEEFNQRMADPIEDPQCKDAKLALNDRCPKGCLIDYATLVVVPGKVLLDIFPSEKSPGCRVRAQRGVKMQGRCVAGESPDMAPVPESATP